MHPLFMSACARRARRSARRLLALMGGVAGRVAGRLTASSSASLRAFRGVERSRRGKTSPRRWPRSASRRSRSPLGQARADFDTPGRGGGGWPRPHCDLAGCARTTRSPAPRMVDQACAHRPSRPMSARLSSPHHPRQSLGRAVAAGQTASSPITRRWRASPFSFTHFHPVQKAFSATSGRSYAPVRRAGRSNNGGGSGHPLFCALPCK
jgi:hypothetical protein